jgi:hypothetical protein
MLKQNTRFDYQYPLHYTGGATLNDRAMRNRAGENRKVNFSDALWSQKASYPDGYRPPYCLIIATKPGCLGAGVGKIVGTGAMTSGITAGRNIAAALVGSGALSSNIVAKGNLTSTIAGTSTFTGTIAGAVFLTANLTGSGSVNADVVGIAALSAALQGVGEIDANISASVYISADLTGSGSVDADVTGGMWISADLAGTSNVDATIKGMGNISADITVTGNVVFPTADEIATAVVNKEILGSVTVASSLSEIRGFAGQVNFGIQNQVYDSSGHLTSATITIYTDNTKNTVLKSLTLAAVYDGDGNCTSYEVMD